MSQQPHAIDPRAPQREEHARSALIAARLRSAATDQPRGNGGRIPWFAIEHAVAADLGHLHAAHDLREVPIISQRRVMGPLIVRVKRVLWQLLHPLPEAQSTWNGADARVLTFMMRQLAAQARAIESLEDEIAELHGEPRE